MSVATALTDVLPSTAISGERVVGPWQRVGIEPEAVVHPEAIEEVSAALRWAGESGVRIIVVGSGRHLPALWQEGRFVVLSTARLNGIEIYEPADLTLTARSGTSLADIDAELRSHSQWLPFDPPRLLDRTLGGFVATGQSGPLWMGYGELRNHVLGMTIVSGDGRLLKLGGRVMKNVAGFDLLKPIVGSHGRFGVITSVSIRAFPVPAVERVLVLRADSVSELWKPARSIRMAPVMPVSSVLITPAKLLDAPAALIVRLHGAKPTVEADQRTLEHYAGVSFDLETSHGLLESIQNHAAEGKTRLIASVLPTQIPEVVSALGQISHAGIAVDTYAGRARFSAGDVSLEELYALRKTVEALGGSLTVWAAEGAHETVLSTRKSDVVEALGSRLERVFDPKGVMWRQRL